MFAIILPAAIAPIVVTLFWAQHRVSLLPQEGQACLTSQVQKAKKLGVEATNYLDQDDTVRVERDSAGFVQRVWRQLLELDAMGLLLFAYVRKDRLL
jgi:hypothetical protein